MPYCQVALALPLQKTFDYHYPEGMPLELGSRVQVPFGKRQMVGFVVGLSEQSDLKVVKDVRRVLDRRSFIPLKMLEFSRWLAQYYLAGWGEALSLAAPPWNNFPGKVKVVRFLKAAGELETWAASLKPRLAKNTGKLFEAAKKGSVSLAELQKQKVSKTLFRAGLENGFYELIEEEGDWLQDAPDAAPVKRGPALNPGQGKAVEAIAKALERGGEQPFLLHGITGSGKTEVYLNALEKALALGGGAIVLVPEIALTPQTMERFSSRFPGQVAILHSGLSKKERAASFYQLFKGRMRVALGPRSALFAPVRNLKLIVVDEESEPSYKQENAPRYHARDAALMRGRMEKAVVVLGSATPSFESFYNAESGKYQLLELPSRVGNSALPIFHFLKTEAGARSGGSDADNNLVPALVEEIRQCLQRREQVLLFLNRRGFAPVLACVACGHAVGCPRCSISLTYHKSRPGTPARPLEAERPWLLCHLCGHAQRPPEKCPNPFCQKKILKVLGLGTQRLEQEVRSLFPQARVLRVDRDTAQGSDFHGELGTQMRAKQVDILLGTQMIAKGLDFPDLTLVGVVQADASLAFPDFRAAERTFQLLVQVAGRAGRADKPGHIWLQTRQPEHACLQAAARQDFRAFYREESKERKELQYPPFCRLAGFLVRSRQKMEAFEGADYVLKAVEEKRRLEGLEGISILGPAPAPLVQLKGWWRYRLLVKAPNASSLHKLLDPLVYELRPKGCLVSVDVDPLQFL